VRVQQEDEAAPAAVRAALASPVGDHFRDLIVLDGGSRDRAWIGAAEWLAIRLFRAGSPLDHEAERV
jgi:hypothetical protein